MDVDWEDAIASLDDTKEDCSYFRLDEFDDVLSSLLLLKEYLPKTSTQPVFWKWVIVAAHSALQSACVCLLTRTDGSGALDKVAGDKLWKKLYGTSKDGQENLDNPSVEWPNETVANLPELLKRLPDGLSVTIPSSKAESYGFDLPGDLRRLHEFRHKFMHFRPVHWSVEIAGLPRMIRQSVDLTERIINSGHYQRFNRFTDHARELADLLGDIRHNLEAVEINYTTSAEYSPGP